MKTRRTRLTFWLFTSAVALTASAGTALAIHATDPVFVLAFNRVAAPFGYTANLSPPDPCAPGESCKFTFATEVNTSVRPDLDQQVTMSHLEGGIINPCIRVLHQVTNGDMVETIDLIDAEDEVHLTVPAGYHLVPSTSDTSQPSYTLAPTPQ